MDSASMDFRAIAWERGWSFTSLADELGLTCTQVSNRVHQVCHGGCRRLSGPLTSLA